MRRDGDRRPGRLAKPDQLRRLEGSSTIAAVVDDDPAVCAALRRAGCLVLQAEWMPLAELNREQELGRT